MNYDLGAALTVGKDTLWKHNATVEDLISILRQFPKDLPVSAHLRCSLNEFEQVIMIEDQRNIILLNIISDCPFCSQHVQHESETTH